MHFDFVNVSQLAVNFAVDFSICCVGVQQQIRKLQQMGVRT